VLHCRGEGRPPLLFLCIVWTGSGSCWDVASTMKLEGANVLHLCSVMNLEISSLSFRLHCTSHHSTALQCPVVRAVFQLEKKGIVRCRKGAQFSVQHGICQLEQVVPGLRSDDRCAVKVKRLERFASRRKTCAPLGMMSAVGKVSGA